MAVLLARPNATVRAAGVSDQGPVVRQAAPKSQATAGAKRSPGAVRPSKGQPVDGRASNPRRELAGLRDPFRGPEPPKPLGAKYPQAPELRPPGIRGLAVNELHLRGIVQGKSNRQALAVVTSGGTLAYFLHEGDQLYDGTVTRIAAGAVYLHPNNPLSGAGSNTSTVVLRLEQGKEEKP